ncbi:unnamed protein product [Rotaria socialis]
MSLRKLAVTIRNCSYIGDLSQNYKTQDALRIYSQQTIVYEGLNQALRSRKLDILLHYRGFIADMYQGIQTLRREQQHQHTDVTSTFYYRGQRMHVEELELVRQNKYLSINTFFSTSTNPEVAELFMPPLDQNVVQSVLFKLHVNTANEIQPFADIKTCSNVPDEDETLFIPGTIFLINKPWDIFYYIHQGWGLALLKKKETKSLDLALKQLGKALCCLPEPSTCVDKIRRQQCHECYALGYAIIGSIYREMQEYPRSKESYDEALRHCSELPQDHPYVYYLYIPFGKTLRIMKEYNQAIDYHTQALNFIKKEYIFGHYALARAHRALGLDYAEICQYELALKYLKEAFAIYNTMEWTNLLPARKQKMAEEIERIQNNLAMPVLAQQSEKNRKRKTSKI